MSNTTTPPSRPGELPKDRTGCRRAFLIMLAVLGIFVLLGIVGIAVLLALRKPWVEPEPGIDLSPKRPVLYCDEVPPDSACGLFLQATAKVDRHACRLLETAARKLDVQPWPQDALLKASSTALAGQPERADADSAENVMPWAAYAKMVPMDRPWNRAEIEKVRGAIAKLRPTAKLARKAVAAPNHQTCIPSDPEDISVGEVLTRLKALVMGLRDAARFEAEEGRLDNAFSDLELALEIGDFPSRGGRMIERLVSSACLIMALQSDWQILIAQQTPSARFRQQLRFLTDFEHDQEPIAENFRMDYIFMRQQLAMMEQWMEERTPPAFRKLARFSYRKFRSATEKDLGAVLTRIIVLASEPYSKQKTEAFERKFGRAPDFWDLALHQDSVAHFLGWRLESNRTILITRYTQSLAVFRGMRVFLAVKGWETEHGSPPESLAQVVPEWLPNVPEDPFLSGHPFRYIRRKDGVWAVYSVGPDQEDDGARALILGSSRVNARLPWEHGKYDRTGDLVFPSVPFRTWWEGLQQRDASRSRGVSARTQEDARTAPSP